MIRLIVAIDNNRGMANKHGIPWQGKLPRDIADFREKTLNSKVIMGYRTYLEFKRPLGNRENLVVVRPGTEELREGFMPLEDVNEYLKDIKEDVWVIGGGGVFAQTIDQADELSLTRVEGEFDCTVFFPEFEKNFTLKSQSKDYTENGITFRIEMWKRK